jgi:hypothetical protein
VRGRKVRPLADSKGSHHVQRTQQSEVQSTGPKAQRHSADAAQRSRAARRPLPNCHAESERRGGSQPDLGSITRRRKSENRWRRTLSSPSAVSGNELGSLPEMPSSRPCARPDSNRRPSAFKTNALPLSFARRPMGICVDQMDSGQGSERLFDSNQASSSFRVLSSTGSIAFAVHVAAKGLREMPSVNQIRVAADRSLCPFGRRPLSARPRPATSA